MSPDSPTPVEGPALGDHVREVIRDRYDGSGAEAYGIPGAEFEALVCAVLVRAGAHLSEREQLDLLAALHLKELVLARACTAGNARGWDDFVAQYRHEMLAMARQITRDDATARELADGLYADLYGMPRQDGRRISKFDYYMGRGSLKGWLRTVLAQAYVNRCRAQAKDVSLEEQEEAGASFTAKEETNALVGDDRVATVIAESLAELGSEDRFLLASYYLDRRTLAEIGRQLRVHESTISRKIDRVTGALRKRIRQQLQAEGIDRRRCDELFEDLDVRDLDVDVAGNLRQERSAETF